MHLMGLEIANLVIIVVMVDAGCVVTYLSSQRVLRQAAENARRQLELRLDGLTGSMADLEARVAELTRTNAELAALINVAKAVGVPPTDAPHHNGAPARSAGEPPAPQPEEEISPETLAMIAAAVTSYLGKKVRIRSARMLQSPYEIVNPWAQQGRVFVQASHALRSWGHSEEPRSRLTPGVRH